MGLLGYNSGVNEEIEGVWMGDGEAIRRRQVGISVAVTGGRERREMGREKGRWGEREERGRDGDGLPWAG